ncbi:3-keto-disaccharide hydrolase [Croceitalea vernalis]|uniref:DUF1080 domain-containing protein n=1 Tax=Croceitalea vernalis TaxID=3075599 RepID=A0ABU3BHC2_9FLAO|nr:DUF1080 domain-containing protein [Croceitalea sp. P007]MDT0621552.1 DUF1080 domain-containing protein [Croceitalea sp. P007]
MRNLFISLPIILFFIVSCQTDIKSDKPVWHTKKWVVENKIHNQLTSTEKELGWTLLFDGKSLNGWHLYQKSDSTQFSGWTVKNGTLFCDATNETKVFGDLTTDKVYENYELVFDWKMDIRGNGGVFINVQETPEYNATYNTGPEYQLLDSNHSDTNTPLKKAGCLWGVSPQLNEVDVNNSGQWNTSKIIQQNGKIEFYLNGKITAKEDFTSEEWKNKVAISRFKDNTGFAQAIKGKIALQNWYFNSWFRNMKIREL